MTDSELIMQCLLTGRLTAVPLAVAVPVVLVHFESSDMRPLCDATYACVRLTERRMRRCWNTPSKEPPRMSMNLPVHSVGIIHRQVRDNLSKQFKFLRLRLSLLEATT